MTTHVMTKTTEDKIVARTLRELATIYRALYGINSTADRKFDIRADELDPPKTAPTIRERADAALSEYYGNETASVDDPWAVAELFRKHFGDLL